MKTKLLLLLCISICTILNSQDKDLQVISSSAKSFTAENLSLDWTLGELIVDFLDMPGVSLSQGFHQASYQIVAVKSIPAESGLITVFPNPFSAQLTIKMNFVDIQKGDMQLLDMKGASIWKKSFEGRDVGVHVTTSSLPSGSYVFVVSLDHGALVQSYQLLKTQ
jgi:hypothetical protein